MKIKKLILLFSIIPLLAFSIHKYYVSLTEIEFVEKEQSIQIILSIFIDDLELTLNKDNNKTLALGSNKEVENVDDYYLKYLQNNLKVIVNNQLQDFNYIGKKYEEDVVRFYLEISNIKSLNTFEILNTILLRDFPEQQNIVKIKVAKFNKTFYLDKKNDKGLLKF
jgi:uncharacterized membrane protein